MILFSKTFQLLHFLRNLWKHFPCISWGKSFIPICRGSSLRRHSDRSLEGINVHRSMLWIIFQYNILNLHFTLSSLNWLYWWQHIMPWCSEICIWNQSWAFLFQNRVQAKQNLEMTLGYQWKESGGGKSFMCHL